MSFDFPSTQRVLVVQEDNTVALKSIPLDKPGPGQVLIKNAAVAQNPADWKYLAWNLFSAGQGAGIDFAGRIAALGEGVTDWKVGDRVAGCHHPLKATKIAQNAYCEYTIAAAKPLLRVPDNITDEQAATIPVASLTALHGLHIIANFPRPAPLGGHALLVWGGASSVGLYAIQLAHIAGYKVITTASPKNHALVKSQGADFAIDYRAPDVVEQIIAASGRGGVDFVYDAISEGESTALATKTLKKDGPKKIVLVLPVDVSNFDQSVEYRFTAPVAFMNYDAEIAGLYLPRSKSEFELGLDFFENVTGWLKEGRIKPNPVTVRPGGLSGVQDGLEFMKAGKVSGTKLVYRVADTPA